ncbi:uncharacterized protein LOC125778460 [Bactrocera dorsalis]|uniref:RNA-directed DNA polymerase n=1 Tax=Bactrocera dorsalis TaxID=27457 RepID=A0ABM3JSK7_BACDO|nr:uncharacterized protein LOC125778460 [Bactrocera dorsalis]
MDVNHQIVTDCRPIAEPLRRYSGEKLNVIKSEFNELLQLGIIRTSSSPWASPVHLVKKKTGEWRACGDYRSLNAHTQPDSYPIPHLDSIVDCLHGKAVFSKIDIKKAYYNIRMCEKDIAKTAVRTPIGLFEFVVMPFGLKNATQTFQRYIDITFRNMDFVFCYLDDILIFSENEEEHHKHVQLVLQKLKEAKLCVNLSKCEFCVSELNFLGYHISAEGIQPPKERVEAICQYPKPNTIVELRRFLGMVNFYRKHIPNAAQIQAPLHNLFKDSKKNDKRKIDWDAELEKAFSDCRASLATQTLLNFPVPNAPFALTTDASETAAGAHLEQQVNGEWKPIAFFSTKLKNAQKNYSAYDRELLAIYLAIKHFRPILDGRKFVIRTDHKPLTYAFRQKADKASPRQKLKLPSGNTIYCDTSNAMVRPYVPVKLRNKIFQHIHNFSHPGTRSTLKQIRSKYIWLSMNKDVKEMVRSCISCQRSKIQKHNHLAPKPFKQTDQRFDHVHLDIIILPEHEGYRYCLTMIDRFTRWPELVPLKDISANTITTSFYSAWISRFGSPKTITTDQGSQFESAIFQALTKMVGAHKIRTSAYHPASNGMIERWHRTLKASLMCNRQTPWPLLLPTVMLGLRCSHKEDIGASPAEMLYGTNLRLPGEFFDSGDGSYNPQEFISKFREYIQQLKPSSPVYHNSTRFFINKNLHDCSHVFIRSDHVRKPLEPPYSGPFEVVERISDRLYAIKINNAIHNISVERLKPAFIPRSDELPDTPLRTYRKRNVTFADNSKT